MDAFEFHIMLLVDGWSFVVLACLLEGCVYVLLRVRG